MSRITIAITFLLLGCTATSGAWAAFPEDPPPSAKPVDIRIVSVPEDETNRNLLYATWVIVLANVVLCGVSWVAARKQSLDMRDSILVSEKAAVAAGRSADAAVRSSDAANASAQVAAQQKREMLERETNIVAHRVVTASNRVQELVTLAINLSNQIYRDFNSMPEKQALDAILARNQEAADNAQAVLASAFATKLDDVLAGDLRQLDQHLVRLEAFKEQLLDENFDLRRVIRENQESARRAQDRAEQQFRDMRNQHR